MALTTRNPENIDLLQSTKFRLTMDRLPGMIYFCQSANLPGVSLSEIPRQTPFVDLYIPGEKIIYDTLNITFLVDEELRSWTEIHDWIRHLTFPTEFEEYVKLNKFSRNITGMKADQRLAYTTGVLSIYTNKNNANFRVNFVDLFPISLSTIIFSSSDTAENVITADATFRFGYYNYERV